MSDRAPVIQVTRLSMVLGGRLILDGIDAQFLPGELVALTGENGSGKTTFLRCLASLSRATSGQLLWFGEKRVNASLKRQIGMLGHECRLYPHLTAHENLIFAAKMYSLGDATHRADRWLQSSQLADSGQRLATQLSRGMRQRLAVARALIHDPAIVLMDEPFAGLDGDAASWLSELLRQLASRNRMVIFSTHDPQRIQLLATRELTLRSGRLHEGAIATEPATPQVWPAAA